LTSPSAKTAEILALIGENSRSITAPREDIVHLCIDVEAAFADHLGDEFCQSVGEFIDLTRSRVTGIRVSHAGVTSAGKMHLGRVHACPEQDGQQPSGYEKTFPYAPPRAGELVLHKAANDAFQNTDLEDFLKDIEQRIGKKPTIIVSGCFVSSDGLFERPILQCMDHTILSALLRGYSVVVAEDRAFAYGEGQTVSWDRFNKHPLCKGQLVAAPAQDIAAALCL
ncbi:MAG TPA: isochorismatase family protein, partial [Alphaproteobacteria bacterium]|nr:isochorismatase family protein [Alphaproteobacteria bacterium]